MWCKMKLLWTVRIVTEGFSEEVTCTWGGESLGGFGIEMEKAMPFNMQGILGVNETVGSL